MNTQSVTPATSAEELSDIQFVEKMIHLLISQGGSEDPELQKEMERFESQLLEIGNRLAKGDPWEYGFAFE